MTFIDLIKAQGFKSIKEFLDSMPNESESPDFTTRELKAIKRAESATEVYLGASA